MHLFTALNFDACNFPVFLGQLAEAGLTKHLLSEIVADMTVEVGSAYLALRINVIFGEEGDASNEGERKGGGGLGGPERGTPHSEAGSLFARAPFQAA